ncbi:mutator type transposase [Tanacetum coccineum]
MLFYFCLSIICRTELDDVNHASVNEDTHHGNIDRYDADSRENEEPKDDDDVMIDEEHEIHEGKVEVYLFGLKESDYQFTTIDVSSEVEGDVYLISSKRFSCKVKVMETNMLSIVVKFSSSKEVKDKVYLPSIETRKELTLVRNAKLRLRATCFGKTPVYTTASHVDIGGEINGKGLKAGKRELLGIDGAFMKGAFPGQVLTVVGIDENNGIYPVAYALVKVETKNSWC